MIAVASDTALGTGSLIFNGNNNGNSLTGIRSANASTRTLANNLQFGGGNIVQFGAPATGDLIFNGPSVNTDGADKTIIVSNANTTINNSIANNSRLIKTGPGILEFTATNSYSGNTTNLAGTLLVNGVLGGNSLTIASGTLGGTGTITAPVIVQAGATLSPGASVGTLTISNTLLLSGTAS